MEHLRKRFRQEYLSQLVLKTNKKENRSLKEGDIVLIGDDSQKRLDWPMAKVEKLYVGRGNVVRVALLRTQKGTCKRPIQRLYPLEINSVLENDKIDEDTERDLRKKVEKQTKLKKSSERVPIKDDKIECEAEPLKTRSGRVSKKPDFFGRK